VKRRERALWDRLEEYCSKVEERYIMGREEGAEHCGKEGEIIMARIWSPEGKRGKGKTYGKKR